MRKLSVMTMIGVGVLTFACLGMQTVKAETTVGLDIASAYIFRGTTINDSFVAQPSLEAVGHGVTLGTWANLDLDDSDNGAYEAGNISEVDLYASYELPLGITNLSISTGYSEYTYPRAGGSVGADGTTVEPVDADSEFNLVAEANLPLSPTLGVYYGVDGAIDQSVYTEATIGYEKELPAGLTGTAGALIAYLNPDEGEDGFSHAALSAGLEYGMFSVGITYFVETDDDVLVIDEDVLGTIGFSHDF